MKPVCYSEYRFQWCFTAFNAIAVILFVVGTLIEVQWNARGHHSPTCNLHIKGDMQRYITKFMKSSF